MSSIVLELQRKALDRTASVSGLLRKALVVARKLHIENLEKWVLQELNGYNDSSEIPDYRVMHGEIKVWNAYRVEWIPVFLDDPSKLEKISKRACVQSIAEIEILLRKKLNGGLLNMPFSHKTSLHFMKKTGWNSPPALIIPESSLHRILDAVRNAILEWALKLEEARILGEGLSFSTGERKAAAGVVFNIGSMSHSQIQQGTIKSMQSMDIKELDLTQVNELIQQIISSLSEIQLQSPVKDELLADIQTIQKQISSPNPKHSIIRELLESTKRILETAVGGAISSGLVYKLSSLLS
jgi:hypothetical protein